jgi:glycosyltransferase involved in cell wall biosynthesis
VNVLLSPITYFPRAGGVGTSMRLLARGLAARGHGVVVVTPKLEPTDPDLDVVDGIDVHRLPFAFPVRLLWDMCPTGVGPFCRQGPRDLGRLFRILAAARVDVVNVQSLTGPNLPYLWLASRLGRRGLVASLQGSEFVGVAGSATRVRRALLRRTLRAAARVTAVSRRVAAEAAGFCPEAAAKVGRIPTAVRVDDYRGVAPFPFAAPYLLSLARLNGLKGHDVLLSAFQQVAKSEREVHLVIAGDGPQRARLHAITLALGLRDRVTFLGEVGRERVPALLAGCRFLVLSSWSEGIPNVIVEAMAAGKAVVATSVGGVPEVVTDPETGRLVSPGDPGEMAEAMSSLLQDPARCAAMGEAGRAFVREHHDLDRVVAQYEAVYRAAMAASAGPGTDR